MMESTIVKYAVYPPIGIARVGNSPEEYFFAPEIPGKIPKVDFNFKDAEGRIKRQAVRFRVYGLNQKNEVVKEITSNSEVSISWEVHLANRKGVTYQFNNAMDLGKFSLTSEKRNKSVTGAQRQELIIDGGVRTISGENVQGPNYRFDSGFFLTTRVNLGEIRTDEHGRLIVLGGLGKSESLDGSPPTTFANNDGWYDDTSDGPVRATVHIGSDKFEAEPAMVAVCPPNYGQGLFGVVTMYDVVYDTFCRHPKFEFTYPKKPNFWEHISPIFDRLVKSQWVNEGAYFLFGSGSPSNFSEPTLLAQLSDTSDTSKAVREEIFDWFRNPEESLSKPSDIPPFYGDGFSEYQQAGIAGLSVTLTQYEWLRQWAAGNFDSSPIPLFPDNFSEIPVELQPEAITRAHLEDCLGGPFHPGIELTWTMRVASMWKAPFRLNIMARGVEPRDDYGPVLTPEVALGSGGVVDESGPGTLTRWMGVPWQTDEASCQSGYELGSYLSVPSFWAARVPNQVLSERSYKRMKEQNVPLRQREKHFDYRQKWLRYFRVQYLGRIDDMVKKWHQVGIVSPQKTPMEIEDETDNLFWVESEVDYDSFFSGDATYQQLLIAENGIEQEAGMALPTSAAAQLSQEVQSVADRTQRRVLGRDEM